MSIALRMGGHSENRKTQLQTAGKVLFVYAFGLCGFSALKDCNRWVLRT